ncbi:MAG: hypothetical protein RLZZ626_702 [Actinomycetota bacterium]|jgi:branched-chain amino acid transport system substrate-binding protein
MSANLKRTVATAAAAAVVATALVGGASAANAASGPLKIGAIVPITGALAFLAPPEIAGIQMAVDEINAAGGVHGAPVQLQFKDSGDTTTPNVAPASANDLLNWGAQGIVGAASSGVSKLIINNITSHKVVQISPANTSPDFTGWKDGGYYFRTAPSDLLQGAIIANQIAVDGNRKVAVIYQDSSYGNGLETKAVQVLKSKGVTVTGTYKFAEGESNFSTIVASALSKGPQAVLLISYDESKKAIPALQAKKFAGSKIYLVDGNLADYSDQSFASYIKGAKGTLPGKATDSKFKAALAKSYAAHNNGAKLTEFAYGAEAYDATILIALAATEGSNYGPAIQSHMIDVSTGGTKVTTFKAGAALLKKGKNIDYEGQSGPVEFDKVGDPTGAYIGIYQYDNKGVYATHLLKVVAGNTVK